MDKRPRRKWGTPEARAAQAERTRQQFAATSPEQRAETNRKRGESLRRAFALVDPQTRARRNKARAKTVRAWHAAKTAVERDALRKSISRGIVEGRARLSPEALSARKAANREHIIRVQQAAWDNASPRKKAARLRKTHGGLRAWYADPSNKIAHERRGQKLGIAAAAWWASIPADVRAIRSDITSRAVRRRWAKMSDKEKRDALRPLRKALHAGPTRPEREMAALLDALGVRYKAEYPIAHYRVDFYVPSRHLVIEVDGEFWHRDRAAQDRLRDKTLRALGYQVFRVWAKQVTIPRTRARLLSLVAAS